MKNNLELKIKNSKFALPAFTLVELMIVVSILGILAAIVIPEFQGHIQQAKESAAKDNLRILREAIERYDAENGVAPGYQNDNPNNTPSYLFFYMQMIENKNYLSILPENPITGISAIKFLQAAETIPVSASITESFGWIYQPSSKTIKLNAPGEDSAENVYYDY